MAFSYLGGKKWAEVTRDERFFCQRLFTLADEDPVNFVRVLNRLSPELKLSAECAWEVGFEVCFFRDIRFLLGEKWRHDFHYSPKRTFDLCLFAESDFVVIEAKAQQGFHSDTEQLNGFVGEKVKISEILGPRVRVQVLPLASSEYLKTAGNGLRELLGLTPVSWRDLAQAYASDEVLLRADSVYEAALSGLNNDKYVTGEELIALWKSGMELLVGRGGGLEGAALQQDIISGAWRRRKYETNQSLVAKPNDNWFALSDFARKVSPDV